MKVLPLIILLFSICFQSCEAQDDYGEIYNVTVMQWNIGHFSEGKSSKSAVTTTIIRLNSMSF